MVNDIKDANDLPDCVYLTDGTVDDRVTIVSEWLPAAAWAIISIPDIIRGKRLGIWSDS